MVKRSEFSNHESALWRWILLIVLFSLLGETLIVRLFQGRKAIEKWLLYFDLS